MTKVERQQLELEQDDSELSEVFSQQLNYYLEQSGMSNERLCTLLDMSNNTLYGWRSGKSTPTLKKAAEAARILGCDLKDLVTRKEPELKKSESAEKLRLNISLKLIDLSYEKTELVAALVDALSSK